MVSRVGAEPAAPPLTVLHDGACPLCRREIGLYRGLQASTPLCFADASDAAQPLPQGSSRAQRLARFEVLDGDGRLLSGAQASLALWAALPGWRWLARIGRLPGTGRPEAPQRRQWFRMLRRMPNALDRRAGGHLQPWRPCAAAHSLEFR